MSSSDCQHSTLVVGETCRVDRCSGGTIHIVLGDLALCVSESSFLTTATAFGIAARRLEAKGGHSIAVTRLLS